jgi:hypothetical protein
MAGDIIVWSDDKSAIDLDIAAITDYMGELFGLRPFLDGYTEFEKPGLRVGLDSFGAGISISLTYYEGQFKDEYITDPLVFQALLFCVQGFDPERELEMYAPEGIAGDSERSTPYGGTTTIREIRNFLRHKHLSEPING